MGTTRDFRVDPGWRMLLRDLRVRPADVFRRAGLAEDLFSRPEARLSASEYFRLWEALEVEVGDPALPIRVAEAATAEGFAPPLFAALCSPNLSVGLERLSRYKRLVAPCELGVSFTRAGLRATFSWVHADEPPPASMLEMEAAYVVRLARIATRELVRPVAVALPEPGPAQGELERFLGVRTTKGPELSVTFSREDAERPFLTANESMWVIFEPELRRRLAELDERATVRERVRAALLELLPSGRASIDDVAARLATSRRTLQRRLQVEGVSYQTVLDETREQLARHYLGRTSLSCAEISFLLGFEHPSSFFRAFHDWTGDSPERMRQSLVTH